jgi:radical SAM superfamily enzyme YgiQ (UPF0313 family)
MRVCLISPPYDSAVKSVVGVSSPPLSLAYLASVLRDEHEVKIIDSNILDYTMEDVRRELREFYPDIVGVTSVTPSIPQAYHVAKMAKEVRNDCIVLIGGSHATFLPHQTLKECEFIDIVVREEGEETVQELLKAVENGEIEKVKGITFRKGGHIVSSEPRPFIKDLDEIPFPSWDLLPIDKYQFYGKRYMAMLTSRGCPFGCSFCASSRLFGGFWRCRSPENVLEEIKTIYENYKIRNIEFIDDTFTLNIRRAEEICNGIIEQGLDISWGASSRVDTLTKGLVEKMKKAGCWILFLGIESGCQKILDAIGKRITVEQVRKAVKTVKQAGIKILGSFILGFPQDDDESIKQTINFAKSLDLDYAEFSILTPYPGTPVFDYATENNLLLTRDWSKYTVLEPVMQIKGVNEKQLKSLLQKAYLSFYLRPKIVWDWLKNKQFIFIKSALKTVVNYLEGISFM